VALTPLSALGYLATIALFGCGSAAVLAGHSRALRLPVVPLAIVFPVAWTASSWAVGHQGDIRFPLARTPGPRSPTPRCWCSGPTWRRAGVTLWLVWANVMIVKSDPRERGAGSGSGSRPGDRSPAVMSRSLAAWGTAPGVSGRSPDPRGRHRRPHPARTRASGRNGIRATPTAWWRSLREHVRALEARGPLDLLAVARGRAIPRDGLAETPGWDAAVRCRWRVRAAHRFSRWHSCVRSGCLFTTRRFFLRLHGPMAPASGVRKHYLVPVVESASRSSRSAVPERAWTAAVVGGFPGPRFRCTRQIGRFGVVICYGDPRSKELARAYRRAGADFLGISERRVVRQDAGSITAREPSRPASD